MKIYPDGSGGFVIRSERGFVIPLDAVIAGSPGTADLGVTQAELETPGSAARAAVDAVYALIPERIYLSVPRISAISATASPANIGNWVAYSFSSAAVQQAGVEVDFPTTWQTYRVFLHWTNLGTGAGNAAWIFAYGHWAEGDSYNTSTPSSQTASAAYAAPSQYVLAVDELSANIAVNPNGPNLLRVIRNATDASDTLENAAGVIGLLLERVS